MTNQLYENKLIKIDIIMTGDTWQEFKILEDKNLIGMILVGTDGIKYSSCNIYITWIFFEKYSNDDLVYFIQDNEELIRKELEEQCISIWDYHNKVIVNNKEIILEDLGSYF